MAWLKNLFRAKQSRPVGKVAQEVIDYFASVSKEEEALRRIKGNWRREMVRGESQRSGHDSVPAPWRSHELPEAMKAMMQSQHPRARGGEDLPDLLEGEVEIARLTLVDSVHGEVTSLRGRERPGMGIELRMVDEYQSEFRLPYAVTKSVLTAEEVVDLFDSADPSPTDTECEVEFQSFYYLDLDVVAKAKHARGTVSP